MDGCSPPRYKLVQYNLFVCLGSSSFFSYFFANIVYSFELSKF